jgi:hypothetical protein
MGFAGRLQVSYFTTTQRRNDDDDECNGLAQVLFVVNVVASLRRGKTAH